MLKLQDILCSIVQSRQQNVEVSSIKRCFGIMSGIGIKVTSFHGALHCLQGWAPKICFGIMFWNRNQGDILSWGSALSAGVGTKDMLWHYVLE